MKDIKETLYRPSWQKLRVSCIAKNNPYGGFTTIVGTNDAIGRLFNYLNDADPTQKLPNYVQEENGRLNLTPEEEYASRVYRVHNMLTATHMGFMGIHKGGTEADQIVLQARARLEDKQNSRLVSKAADKWDWDVFAYEMETMWREEQYWFNAIYTDLLKRQKQASRKRTLEKGVDDSATTRRELTQAMSIITNIRNRR